jgi:hypothetical protein
MKGSRRRMCEWANAHRAALESRLLEWPSLGSFHAGGPMRWLCPLRPECSELRDGLWKRAELPEPTPQQDGWWPARGPVWDGAAVVVGSGGGRGVVLIEAKSHADELKSGRSAAEGTRLNRIRASLAEVKEHLGVPAETEWTGSYYQVANRLAYLYYLRKRGIEAWLVSIYFLGDQFDSPGRQLTFPATEEAWRPYIAAAKAALGLPEQHPLSARTRELFLPAVP